MPREPIAGLRALMTATYDTLLTHADLLPSYLARQGARGPNAQRLGELVQSQRRPVWTLTRPLSDGGSLMTSQDQHERREPSDDAGAQSEHRWALILASVASLMIALDLLVVATALSTIRSDLEASVAELQWTVPVTA